MSDTTIPEHARGYDDFGGVIGRTFAESTPEWPEEKRAADGAPNIIFVLLDDMGYSDIGPFGSEIDTPTLDRIAKEGYALTNYHTTPVCSPARAAALTGLNAHRAGFASVANMDPGFPGLRLEIADDVLTLPEILRDRGYATYGVGKWHLTRDALANAAADKSTWPLQRGFDQFYGSLEGFNSFFHPNQIIRDNTAVQREQTPEGYYLTDDYTDQAETYIKALRASDSRKPFFLYFAHTAMHGPHGAKPEDIAKYRGAYAKGWDHIREERHARQIEQGIIPKGTPLPEREGKLGRQVDAWESLDEDTRDLYARYQEVYAAMVDNVDQSLGRILGLLDELGERENTIVVFTSDNGGTAEGGEEGTRSYFSRFSHVPGVPAEFDRDVDRDPDLIGGPRTMVHYPEGWGMASNTPFRFYKGQTYAGGIRVPLLISWPKGLPKPSEDSGIRHQYQYVTDLLPTLLDLAEVEHPGVRHNLPAKSIDGFSFAPVVKEAAAPSTHPEQYSEHGGNRGFYRDGWKIVANHRPGTPFDDGEWELYRVSEDPNEIHDVKDLYPEKLRELAEAWDRAAWSNTVYPLNDRTSFIGNARRPAEEELTRPVRLLPGTPKLERYRSSKLTALRDFTVDVDLYLADGDQGVLFSHGDQGGGYVVYIKDGAVHLAVNEYGVLHDVSSHPSDLTTGIHTVTLRASALPDFRADYLLEIDGTEVTALRGLWSFFSSAPFSGIDVGVNRGGPVHWGLYEEYGSFRFSGDLHAVTYTPGAPASYNPEVLAALELDARAAAEAFD